MVEEKKSYWKEHSSYYTNENYRRNILRRGRTRTFEKHLLKMGCDSYDSYIDKVIEGSYDQITERVFTTADDQKISSKMISGYGIAKVLRIQHLTMLKLLGLVFDSQVMTRNGNRYYSLAEYLVLAEAMYVFKVRGYGSLKEYEAEVKELCGMATEQLEKQILKHGSSIEELNLGFTKDGGKDEYVNRVKEYRRNLLKNKRIARILDKERCKK